MRHVLVLGGTAWLGRHIAQTLVAQGDSVTCLARGSSGSVPSGVNHVVADRRLPGAYDDVVGQPWDDVVELSYDHELVTGALSALADDAAHWTLVSSISVYASNEIPDCDESAPVFDPVPDGHYGEMKVAAEAASVEKLGDRLLIARPGLICGVGDPSDRFGYWVGRCALAADDGGQVLVPRFPDGMVQVIDVLDLSAWIVDAGRRGLTGAVNATGTPQAFDDVVALAGRVAGFSAGFVEVSDEWLAAQGVAYWAGADSLPLWLPGTDVGFARRNTERFRAAGGVTRELAATMASVLADERARGLGRARTAGLSRTRELELLAGLG